MLPGPEARSTIVRQDVALDTLVRAPLSTHMVIVVLNPQAQQYCTDSPIAQIDHLQPQNDHPDTVPDLSTDTPGLGISEAGLNWT